MSIITSELNYKRSAHRIDLPMMVEIDGVIYKTNDWSMGGVGLLDFTREISPDTVLDARCILPMKDSTLSINVKLIYRDTHNKISGFSFQELGTKNRRVLRHYVELAVDGKLDNLEDLVSIVTAPSVSTPIEDALNLSDLESESLARQFKTRSYLAIAAGVLFLVVILATLFYNTVYRIQATGLVSGNLEKITANASGIISKMLVKEETFIPAGTPLFQVENPDLKKNLKIVRAKRTQREEQIKTLRKELTLQTNYALLRSLKAQLQQRQEEFSNARELFKKRIISFKDLKYLENQLQQARTSYEREQKVGDALKQEQRQRIDLLQLEINELVEQEKALLQSGASLTIRSPMDGKIFHIENQAGSFVHPKDPVILLERNVKPYVLIKLRNEDALKVRLGLPVEVYIPWNSQKYIGEITAIGYTSINSGSTATQEASLNETLLKIEFRQAALRLPANSRVKVWIKTF